MNDIHLEIWSDIACPWCWIGKRSLETALEQFDAPVKIRWRAFQLDPSAPRQAPERVDYAARLAAKYRVDKVQAQAFIDRMVEAGRERGLEIRFDRIRPGNTLDAHRLLAWARESGRQTELGERLFRAYLHEGRSIADHATLVELAEDVDLPGEEAATLLDSDARTDAVHEDQEQARRLGITGVPCFVFRDTGLSLSGAQPPEVLLDALRQTRRRVTR